MYRWVIYSEVRCPGYSTDVYSKKSCLVASGLICASRVDSLPPKGRANPTQLLRFAFSCPPTPLPVSFSQLNLRGKIYLV
jgi:hypothetical protein